jgi:A/G-specific adenine glycosylase
MLQQTRAATAIPYWERFLRELPTVHTLAEAPQERVLALWSGLGYYRRARMLHAAARRVVSAHGGELPRDLESLRNLDGVGSYTAGAIASIAFKQRVAAVDGNVTRVLSRLFAVDDPSCEGRARIRAFADAFAAVDEGDPGDWTQALMELGALVCTPRQPRCPSCPARAHCEARSHGAAFAAALPAKAAKPEPREKKTVHLVAFVLTTKAGVVLARRGQTGNDQPKDARKDARKDAGDRKKGPELYAGLWETPLAPCGEPGSVEALAACLGVALEELREAGSVVHVLSHRRLVVKVLRGSLGRAPLAVGRTGTTPAAVAPYDAFELVPYKGLPTRAHATLTRKVLDMAKVSP